MAIKSKKLKLTVRERKKFRLRQRITGTQERPRVTIFKSRSHTSAQAILDLDGKTIISASTQEKEVMKRAAALSGEGMPNDSKSTKSVRAAKAVGLVLAERLKEKSFSKVVFDRNGFLYHGRVKAIADGAREGGLDF